MSTSEVSVTGEGLTIVVNTSAGGSTEDAMIETIEAELPDAIIVRVDDSDRLDELTRQAARNSRALGVVGGDGSVSAAAAIAHSCDVPLAVFPGGTLNHFARDAGLDTLDDALRAVRGRRLATFDMGLIDGRAFVNTASVGSYPQLVERRERYEGTIGKWPAAAVALAGMLFDSEPFALKINGIERRIWMIFIGNCAYDPAGFAPAARRRLDDGLLDVRTIDAGPRWARTRLAAALLTGRLGRSPVYTRSLVSSLDLDTHESRPLLAADGEAFPGGSAAFQVTKAVAALRVFVVDR